MRDLLADGGRVQTAMVDALWSLRRNGPSMPAWTIRCLFDGPWGLPLAAPQCVAGNLHRIR